MAITVTNKPDPIEIRFKGNTLETILKWKLCKWVGSNLPKSALAADSWTDGDERLESNRVSDGWIASVVEKDCGSRVINKMKMIINALPMMNFIVG